MGEIRIVGPGKTRGYPYLVCKKKQLYHDLPVWEIIHSIKKLMDYLPEQADKPWYKYYIMLLLLSFTYPQPIVSLFSGQSQPDTEIHVI